MIRLGVNIDHVATLREVRKARYPDIVEALHLCERGGADQITVHLREDRRHIQDEDVSRLLQCSLLPINLEMAYVSSMVDLALAWKPYSVTLVPEKREEMTTESGLNLLLLKQNSKDLDRLQESLRVIPFLDPSLEQVRLAKELKMDGIEFHTGPYALAFEEALRSRDDRSLIEELRKLTEASQLALDLGLDVRAGHGLTIQNVKALTRLPGISEFNIGHAIVARSILMGLEAAVREMKNVIMAER